jgi:DNA-directed RNA polymerase specialized sigma24 family protein
MVEQEPKWIEDVVDVATTVAYSITRNYKGYAEVEDLRQELLEWCLKRQDKVREWLDVEDRKEYQLGIKRLSKTLNRRADKYCRREKAKKSGYLATDEYFYTPGLVEQLLPYAFKGEVPTKDPNNEFVSNGAGDPALGGGFLATMYDIRIALLKLNIGEYGMLRMRFEDGMKLEDIAEHFNVSDSTISRKINTSIRKVIKVLGGESPWH